MTMKLSDNTINVLKNFASINSGMVFSKGVLQRTHSPERNIMAEAVLDDEITVDQFGIFDLHKFITNISTLNNPELTFKDLSVLMSDKDSELMYYGATPDVILGPEGRPSTSKLETAKMDVSFLMPKLAFQQIMKLASLNGFPNISIIGEKGKLFLQAHDRKNDTSNIANVWVCDYDGTDFRVMFKADNLKMIPDDYNVSIHLSTFVMFENITKTLKYYVALEKVR